MKTKKVYKSISESFFLSDDYLYAIRYPKTMIIFNYNILQFTCYLIIFNLVIRTGKHICVD